MRVRRDINKPITEKSLNGLYEYEKDGEIVLFLNGRKIANRKYFGKWHRKQIITDWNECFDMKGKEVVLVINPNLKL